MNDLDTATPEEHRQRYLALRQAAQARAGQAQAWPAIQTEPDAADILHHEAIPGGWYWTTRVARGRRLRIASPAGTASVSVMLWNAADTSERYNAADTVKLQWSALIGKGRLLFSDMGRVLAVITEDTAAGLHDTLTGGSTPQTNARKYNDPTLRNTRDNFRLAAGKLGLSRRDIPPCITFFAGVGTDAAGGFVWRGSAPAGSFVELRADLDLLAVLSNCPHPLDPNPVYAPGAVHATILRGDPPAPDDPYRLASEEATRGYGNNDAYLRL
jgi:urea carboxylase-associated protein 2